MKKVTNCIEIQKDILDLIYLEEQEIDALPIGPSSLELINSVNEKDAGLYLQVKELANIFDYLILNKDKNLYEKFNNRYDELITTVDGLPN